MKYFIDESANDNPYIIDKYFVKSDNGVDNCCIIINGHDHPLRYRASIVIIDTRFNKLRIIAKRKSDEDDYSIPGGGINKNETPLHAAIREGREETLCNSKRVKEEGILIEYNNDKNKVDKWVKTHVPEDEWWYGYYTVIHVGLYDGLYNGHVDEEDREYGYHWTDIKEVMKHLPKEYRDAINNYINEYLTKKG